MAKIAELQQVALTGLKPYDRNAKTHSPEQVASIARSIREFGFLSPCLIDRAGNIIAGHGRVLAAESLGMKTVPCVFVEQLTDEQRRAYILADNRLTELGGWNMPLVFDELEALDGLAFDITLTGFTFGEDEAPDRNADWFEREDRNDTSRQEGNDEYNEFLEKFEQKKTTDDCYTPDPVYKAVADFVATEYGKDPARFVRPFYPGGDYQREEYKPGDVVVDNPPFSILSEIVRFYMDHGISFFLFAPTLTLFNGASALCCAIPLDVGVFYENGANVNTSMLTNLEPPDVRIRTAPRLYEAMTAAVAEFRAGITKQVPKYEYPPHVVTASRVGRLSHYGVDLRIRAGECCRVGELDAQKAHGKSIYGSGYLIGDAAAQRYVEGILHAEEEEEEERTKRRYLTGMSPEGVTFSDGTLVWELSDREREIIAGLE